MFCSQCGTQLSDDSAFCHQCGSRAAGPEAFSSARLDVAGTARAFGGPAGGPLLSGPPPGAVATQVRYASFWQRFGAYLLDSLIMVFLGGIPALVVFFILVRGGGPYWTEEEAEAAAVFGTVIFFLVYVAIDAIYHAAGDGGRGTWGKQALGLRVQDARSGKEIGFGRGLVRYVILIVGSIPLYLGWLWMIWDAQRQTWHDKAANTIIVQRR